MNPGYNGSFKLNALAGYTKTKLEINGLGQTNNLEGNIIENYHYQRIKSAGEFSDGLGLLGR